MMKNLLAVSFVTLALVGTEALVSERSQPEICKVFFFTDLRQSVYINRNLFNKF